MSYSRLIIFKLLWLWLSSSFAITADQLLPADQAFKFSVTPRSIHEIVLSWKIAEGYYLYQQKFKIESKTPEIQLGKIDFPKGKPKHDELFGDVLIYRHQLSISVPLLNPHSLSTLQLAINYQGCADIGVCYPPQPQQLNLTLPTNSSLISTLNSRIYRFNQNLFAQSDLLPAEQAFQLFADLKDAHTLHLSWKMAEGYYLYREKIYLTSETKGIKIGNYQIPPGTAKYDEAFGQVHIFHKQLAFDVPLIRSTTAEQNFAIEIGYQGCADRGVCYPPMKKQLNFHLAADHSTTQKRNSLTPKSIESINLISEQDQIIQSLHHDNFLLTLLSFLGFGLLLSFTPCVFPMIPILSGLIIGQHQPLNPLKAFGLSLSYVLATALTYTLFGILAALFGHNLQLSFQQPWVIALFSSLFIALSLSMFGFYELQLPAFIQTHLTHSSDKHRDGSYIGAAIMGALSCLIVGPCVAAPLAAALVYIGKTGDILLGGSALFMLGLGMGIPLLIVGASAGKLLPKAGNWLTIINPIFGVIMLGTALWMLNRILPAHLMMLLWAMWLIIPAIYLNALEPLPYPYNGWQKLWKGLGIVLLSYGILLLIGLGLGNTNPLQPLKITKFSANTESNATTHFQRIGSLEELNQQLAIAAKQQRWLMLDFYADWCISCKEMEAYTFSDSAVKQQLTHLTVLQIDVTKNSETDQILLKHFNLVGPPAILFFAPNQGEKTQYRIIGYQDSSHFLQHLQKLTRY